MSVERTPKHNSISAALPRMIAPAFFRRWTTGASALGRRPANNREPHDVGIAAVSMLSFTAIVMPFSKPGQRPAARAVSIDAAAAFAPAASTVAKA